MSAFPRRRMRRLRRTESLRALRRETRLSVDDFIYPLFVVEDPADAGEVPSMPGVVRHTVDTLALEIESVIASGIRAVLLFGVPAKKSETATGATQEQGVVPQAVRRIKDLGSELAIFTDVCVCSYTSHGHCGLIDGHTVRNDASLELLADVALAHARAGADLVAPSAMMDGMVGAVRRKLDDSGMTEVGILSYAVKYASSFYGPFRDAADSTPEFGDRRGYQMDPANAREAIAEAALDLEEGADVIMVKPAMPYLDVVRRLRERFEDVPLAAYQVSGEYAMIKAAAKRGWLDERKTVLESLTGIKRAGADVIITYWAKDAARWLKIEN